MKVNAETYSFNIESELFNQLTKEQQALWRKEIEQACISGAKWKEEQFEKNRLAACNRQTKEEAEIESNFVMGIIENEHRQPTFDDAIKYGMRLHKGQMMAKSIDAQVLENWDGKVIKYDETILDEKLSDCKVFDKVKVIIIKED